MPVPNVIEWWGLTFTFRGSGQSITVLDDYDRLKPQYDEWMSTRAAGVENVFEIHGIIRDVDRRRVSYVVAVEDVMIVELCQW